MPYTSVLKPQVSSLFNAHPLHAWVMEKALPQITLRGCGWLGRRDASSRTTLHAWGQQSAGDSSRGLADASERTSRGPLTR